MKVGLLFEICLFLGVGGEEPQQPQAGYNLPISGAS